METSKNGRHEVDPLTPRAKVCFLMMILLSASAGHTDHSHAHSFSRSLTPPEALHLSLSCVLFCVVVCLYKHSGNKNPLVATALGSQTPARAYVHVGEFARPLRWKQSGATSLWVPEERRRLCELTEACRCWRTPPVDGARRLRHHCRTPARRRCALPAERSLS